MHINLIAAMGKNRVIGLKGKIPWDLPADLNYFKNKTIGNTVVMGRKTFESIGFPLKDRENIVISRSYKTEKEGIKVVGSIEDAIQMLKDREEVYIAGGGLIYKAFIPLADRLYITLIDECFLGDTYFPKIDTNLFKLVSEEKHESSGDNPFTYSYLVYDRLKKIKV